jgi:cell division protein FtsB
VKSSVNAPLKTQIQNKVESEILNDAELDQLMRLQVEPEQKQPKFRQGLVWVSSAAVLLIAALWIFAQHGIVTQRQILESIAAEVVENHVKLKPLDTQSASITELQQFFTHLDFQPLQSHFFEMDLALAKSQLVGGRYCSIKGVTAAQLRFEAPEAQMQTVYQVPYDAERFGSIPNIEKGEAPRTLQTNGLQVSMWVEKGLLVVAVQP